MINRAEMIPSLAQQLSEYADEQLARYGDTADYDRPANFKPGWTQRHVCLSPAIPFVALDFETTGFSPSMHEIIEIGAVRVAPGSTRIDIFHRLIRQSEPLPQRIVALTGIDDELLAREGVDPCLALIDLLDFLGDDPVVAYNAGFDLGFLNAACERYGLVAAGSVHSCALALARNAWPHLSSHKLTDIAIRLGIDTGSVHRALGDAVRAANVYRAAVVVTLDLHHLVSARSREQLRAMQEPSERGG